MNLSAGARETAPLDVVGPFGPSRELQRHVLLRTAWRISNLLIELAPGRAVLRGRATTSYARLQAQQAAQEMLPHVRLDNAIEVDDASEVLSGMPLH
jgi:hypothetical protein